MPKILPAVIDFTDPHAPRSAGYGDVYHARAGAAEQARHVWLGGNRLPARWQRRARFVILETGFGLGNNFLETWAAWRNDVARCERLWFVSIEKHPPTQADLARALAASPWPELAAALVDAWPPLTAGHHRLGFDDGRVVLQLVFDDVSAALRELRLQADAFYLDGFAPSLNPQMWDRHVLKALGRLAAPQATAATWSVARPVRDGLLSAGFQVERAPGFGGKREMTVADYAPAYTPRRPPTFAAPPSAGRRVLVIGAGLAGAACARALAGEGCEVVVIERHEAPARAASGNPAGLFHGVVHPQDGVHARFNRAAALAAARCYAPLIAQGRVPGRIDGLLRLQSDADLARMHATLDALGLPPSYVAALDAGEASSRAGAALPAPAWYYPQGGWLDPGALVRHWLADPRIVLRTAAGVHALRHEAGSWRALDAAGATIAEAPLVVLANADDAPRLLGAPGWPLERQRGQITLVRAGATGLAAPRLGVAGGGYAVTLEDGRVCCGASATFGDDDPAPRAADDRDNLDRLAALTGSRPDADDGLQQRVGFRLLAPDRLPVVGAVPRADATADQPRFVERVAGLYVCTALGSRGITWAPLLGELVAAWVTGAPAPLEASLVDALDPARFAVRARRRAASAAPR